MIFIIIGLISIIVILILYIIYDNMNSTERIINLDESRKNMLQECCKDEECYSKPPFLQKYNSTGVLPSNSCNNNKKQKAIELDKMYDMMFSKDHYNKLLYDFKIRSDIDESVIDRYKKEQELKQKELIETEKEMGTDVFNKMIADKFGTVKGFDTFYTNISSYEKTI